MQQLDELPTGGGPDGSGREWILGQRLLATGPRALTTGKLMKHGKCKIDGFDSLFPKSVSTSGDSRLFRPLLSFSWP